jgi:hypothetical protein
MRTLVRVLGEIVVDLNELIVPMLLAGSEMCDIETYCLLMPGSDSGGALCRPRSGLPARSFASWNRT